MLDPIVSYTYSDKVWSAFKPKGLLFGLLECVHGWKKNKNTFFNSFSFVTFYLSVVFHLLVLITRQKNQIVSLLLQLVTNLTGSKDPNGNRSPFSFLFLSLHKSLSLAFAHSVFISHSFCVIYTKLTFQVGLLCLFALRFHFSWFFLEI